LIVNKAVENPNFAVVIAASHPACPPPITMMSKDSFVDDNLAF